MQENLCFMPRYDVYRYTLLIDIYYRNLCLAIIVYIICTDNQIQSHFVTVSLNRTSELTCLNPSRPMHF